MSDDDDPRVFEPLAPGHPAIWEPCGMCDVTFVAGDVTMLVPKNAWTPGSGMTVEGALVHRRCYAAAKRVLGHRTSETLESFLLPTYCFSCGAYLMASATKHEPGCAIQAIIDEFSTTFQSPKPPRTRPPSARKRGLRRRPPQR
jgi:hypothetical protein